jgi:hypothetical protein
MEKFKIEVLMARKKFAVLVNYTDGKIRIDSPPPEKPAKNWEVLDIRPVRREAEEIMMAMAPILKPEIQAMEAAVPA